MNSLTIVTFFILVSTSLVLAEDQPFTDKIPLLLWAASDPAEDGEVDKVDPSKLYDFLEEHRKELNEHYESMDITSATLLMSLNADESGTKGVFWPKVFARIGLRKATGITEKNEHGVPSLVAWVMRNTGSGSKNPSVDRKALVVFIMQMKSTILKYIYDGNVDGLITLLEQRKETIDWKTVINELINNRQLYKYQCGFLGLQLCDSLSK